MDTSTNSIDIIRFLGKGYEFEILVTAFIKSARFLWLLPQDIQEYRNLAPSDNFSITVDLSIVWWFATVKMFDGHFWQGIANLQSKFTTLFNMKLYNQI